MRRIKKWDVSLFIPTNIPSCQGSEYASEAENGEENKGQFDAFQENRIGIWRDLDLPKVDGKYQKSSSHAEGHPGDSHG